MSAKGELLRKARGAFFTPETISRYIAEWAIRSSADRILEPSCGEASFLLEAGNRLKALNPLLRSTTNQLHGIEIHTESAHSAVRVLESKGLGVSLRMQDFFDVAPSPVYDAVVGNPPYVRYQEHAGRPRMKSLEAALAGGVRLNGLASSWAAFTIHAARFLGPEGRLGFVLPAELLAVNYAAPVRRFLLERFSSIRLVLFENLVFPGVSEEVVLLLAEGSGGAKCFEVFHAKDLADLPRAESTAWREHSIGQGRKWTTALTATDLAPYESLKNAGGFEVLSDWGTTYLGAVTGDNDFFALTWDQARKLGLSAGECIQISPPGSRHLKGLKFGKSAWEAAARENRRCFLFHPKEQPTKEALRYIAKGRAGKIDGAYKCAVRTPWWRVPLVEIPDILLTYMNHDCPRFLANEAGVHILNSLYGIRLRYGRKALGRELLPIAALNTVTLLGSELVGRSYGGGLLKLEPREADKLPLPAKALVDKCKDELRAVAPQLSPALRQGNLLAATDMVDEVLLVRGLGVSKEDIRYLRTARASLFDRRQARAKVNRVTN
ncbi:MAG TPA: N-6 DNA methylase [Rhizomicrobium sp.]